MCRWATPFLAMPGCVAVLLPVRQPAIRPAQRHGTSLCSCRACLAQGQERQHTHEHRQEPPRAPQQMPGDPGEEDAGTRKSQREQGSNQQMKQAVAALRQALASKDLDAVNAAAARIAAVSQQVKHQQQQEGVQLSHQQPVWQHTEQQTFQQQAFQQQQQQQLQQQPDSEQQWRQAQMQAGLGQHEQQQYRSEGPDSQREAYRSLRPSRVSEQEQQWGCASPAAAVQTPDWDLQDAPKYQDRCAVSGQSRDAAALLLGTRHNLGAQATLKSRAVSLG